MSDPLVSYYAKRAHEYERIYHKPERQADLRQLRDIVEHEFRDAKVCEVACGTGYWTAILAKSAASVFATDINDEVLAIARSKAIDSQRVTFQCADAYALPVPANRSTAGFSGFWWSHIPKARLRSFLQNFHGVLPPGARVMFIDNAYVEGSSTAIARTDQDGNSYQLRQLDDGSTHEVLKNFPTEQELRSTVADLATDIRVQFLRYFWILTYTL
ncbi:MAG TPA: class I SAM-dependent methyltransferase [Verrucomicrobiae bacterium]